MFSDVKQLKIKETQIVLEEAKKLKQEMCLALFHKKNQLWVN